MGLLGDDEMHVSVESCARIPARRLRSVLQPDGQSVLLSVVAQQGSDVAVERVVAVRPEARLLAVYIYPRLAHGTVEEQRYRFALGSAEQRAIPSAAGEWQSARAPRLERRLRLKVLRDGHVLQIVFYVERSVYGPVVRHAYRLPAAVVELRHCRLLEITF